MWNELWFKIVEIYNSVKNTTTWVDIIDIALVAFLVYQLLKLVRDTRAMQLMKGIIALLVCYFIAVQFHLKTMEFIMQNILQVGVLALFIVFQPELRRALEQVGRTKLTKFNVFSSGSVNQEEVNVRWRKAIAAICDSCAALSRQKIGALIVLEGKTKLGEIIGTGTIVDAEPSMELLGNMFFPNSPLHDGAVIIRDGKVYAAGCFLPLSDNFGISRELGTRHRAALGMSENSDATVVVVSEETGIITVAHAGKLNRGFTREQLADRLTTAVFGKEPEETEERKLGFWKVKK